MFSKSFCSSPWIHLRLNYDGFFVPCRWASSKDKKYHFSNTSIMEFYNSDQMNFFRLELLEGKKPDWCSNCYYEDSFKKINGRTRQLNKSGIILNHFDLSLRSSPHFNHFNYSNENKGLSNYYPVDLQIELGNICNSSCIMCNPMSSSKLANDYIKLNKLEPTIFKNITNYKSWSNDPDLVKKFIEEIGNIPNLKYIHFLGGETLYDPVFYKICNRLVELGISQNIIIGTTTNGTIYDKRVEDLIPKFKEFHLGISIESVTSLNDYIRYPSSVDTILKNIDKFLSLRKLTTLYISLRITPNIFSIYEFDKLIEYMIENQVITESCNILNNPACLKMELLPEDIRQEVIDKLEIVVQKYNFTKNNVVNLRVRSSVNKVIGDIAIDYLNFIKSYKAPSNSDQLRFELVKFLKSFESIRNNSILDYAPRYTEFLRSYGY